MGVIGGGLVVVLFLASLGAGLAWLWALGPELEEWEERRDRAALARERARRVPVRPGEL